MPAPDMFERFQKQFFNIRRRELPLALLMFGYFFLVITTFWILKPLKKGLFIEFYDAEGFVLALSGLFQLTLLASQAELVAKVLNMVVAAGAVIAFTLLARRLRREGLTFVFTGFFIAAFVLYTFLIDDPGGGTVWTFYLLGDLWTTLMVATFFAFLNDSVTPEAAKRLYGLVVLGGVAGGAFGTTFLAAYIEDFPVSTWLWVSLGMSVVILGLAYAAGRLVRKSPPPEVTPGGVDPDRDEEAPKKSNAALEGARLVFRSRYLLAIVGIVGIYEIVSTLLDFQFTATVAHYLDGPAIGQHFATVFAITNVVALVVQLFITTFVLTRFGVLAGLLVTPVVMALGSGAFLAVPALWVGSFLNTADNGFAYSINQSAREALYTPTTRDEKYKAKAFIDMFVQRFAKSL
ncbi:MAG: Npt1/Npt2 family nucleotide transporter, partial [Rhodothermales bacterium]|nr:Npt1/Npt2 family nucleotide transporter [Rhodothermales bacterium]